MPGTTVSCRFAADNPPDLPLVLPTDFALVLGGIPRRGDEIAFKPAHLLVTRVIWRPGDTPLLIVSTRPLPEERGAPYIPQPSA